MKSSPRKTLMTKRFGRSSKLPLTDRGREMLLEALGGDSELLVSITESAEVFEISLEAGFEIYAVTSDHVCYRYNNPPFSRRVVIYGPTKDLAQFPWLREFIAHERRIGSNALILLMGY